MSYRFHALLIGLLVEHSKLLIRINERQSAWSQKVDQILKGRHGKVPEAKSQLYDSKVKNLPLQSQAAVTGLSKELETDPTLNDNLVRKKYLQNIKITYFLKTFIRTCQSEYFSAFPVGGSLTNAVNTVMRKLMSDKAASFFNMQGKKHKGDGPEKEGFANLKLCDMVTGKTILK